MDRLETIRVTSIPGSLLEFSGIITVTLGTLPPKPDKGRSRQQVLSLPGCSACSAQGSGALGILCDGTNFSPLSCSPRQPNADRQGFLSLFLEPEHFKGIKPS